MAMIIWSLGSSDCFSKPCEQHLSFTKPSTSSMLREITGSLKKSFVTKTSSKDDNNQYKSLDVDTLYLTRRRPIIEKWTGEEYEDMEAEFDNIDTNEGGMILFKVKTH